MEHSHIGRYEVVRVLGQGAMGVVFEALDPRLARRVAIKTIRAENLSAEQSRTYEARFDTEARSVARLAHPNIVSVYDSGQIDAMSYLVMEYVPGVNLKDCLRAGVRFSPWGAVRIVQDVLAALGHAHEQRIIHRDIKPENILLDDTGRVKLTDFGIAKMLDSEVDNGTQLSGGSIGTPRYMSPEQVRGGALDERSDLFSVGVLLYELLTGKPPFDGGSAIAIATAILHDEPQPPSVVEPGVNPALDPVLGRALAKVANERFPSSQMFAQVLASVSADWPEPECGRSTHGVAVLVTDASQEALRVLLRELRTEESGEANAPTQVVPVVDLSDADDRTRLYLSEADQVRRVVASAATPGRTDTPPPSPRRVAAPATPAAPSGRRFAWLAAALSGVTVVAVLAWLALRPAVPEPTPAPPAALGDPAQSLSDKEVLVTSSTAASSASASAPAPAPTAVPAAMPPSGAALPPSASASTAKPANPSGTVARKPVAGATIPTATSAAASAAGADAAAPTQPAAAPPRHEPAPTPAPPQAATRPAEPCAGMGFFARESCLWTQCRTDAYRKHPACERFQDKPKSN
ncbi:serine/threonine-protein kinase [Hydrogenophaga soli]